MSIRDVTDEESRHAVWVWTSGGRISSVERCVDPLKPFDAPQGRCRVESICHAMSATDVYCVMAGPLMNGAKGKERPHEYPPGHDFKVLEENFTRSPETWKMYEWFNAHPDADIDGFVEAFKEPVVRLLRSRRGRRAVAALSAKLMKTPVLSGVEAVSIIEKAWGLPRPRLALPADQHGSSFMNPPRTLEDLIYRLSFFVRSAEADLDFLRDTLSERENDVMESLAAALLQVKFILHDKKGNA